MIAKAPTAEQVTFRVDRENPVERAEVVEALAKLLVSAKRRREAKDRPPEESEAPR